MSKKKKKIISLEEYRNLNKSRGYYPDDYYEDPVNLLVSSLGYAFYSLGISKINSQFGYGGGSNTKRIETQLRRTCINYAYDVFEVDDLPRP